MSRHCCRKLVRYGIARPRGAPPPGAARGECHAYACVNRVGARARRRAWALQAGPLGALALHGKGDPTPAEKEG
eukprot:9619288-Alexandrium_andersonii.AAC.1